MQVTNVTNEDGIACTQLLRALRAARFDGLTGADIEAFMQARKWISSLANQMAEQLKAKESKPAPPPPPESGQQMRVRATGPIGSSSKKRKMMKK